MGWRNRPKYIDYCPKNVDYIMFIDENGDSDLKYIKRCIFKNKTIDENSVYFTVTGVIIKRNNLSDIKDKIMEIKLKYWKDGHYKYDGIHDKRICFHSREIRRREKPFSDDLINRENFLQDLSGFLDYVPCHIVSSTINKEKHFKGYCYPKHPYNLNLNFVLERFVKFYLNNGETGIIILEARGKDEDKKVLKHIKELIDNGTRFVEAEYFKKIKGVYFNKKWQLNSNCKKSYFGLEIADLYSYPIHKYCKTGKKDKAFKVLEKKLYNYPYYDGCGIKIFPK